MRETGCPEEDLFSFLSSKRREDIGYRNILSSMCTPPHPVAARAHAIFLETNLGDPGLFPGTAALEELLVERLGTLMHLPDAGGYATSGGTESNIQAFRIAKKQKPVKSPNVVVPASSHFSFMKACDILGLEARTVPLDSQFRMDAEALDGLVDNNTVALVGVVGTTEYGMVDPIARLSEVAEDRDVFLHVDAAFGGMVVPFLDRPVPFDFRLPGVDSISVDPHKMGMSTIPAGCLLTRDPACFACLNVDTPYLTVKRECTLAGTRPGASVAAAVAVLEYLGMDGMRAVVAGCMENARRLIEGMETLGCPRAVTPDVNVATFSCDRVPAGWRVSRTRNGHMRIVCMPHVTRDVIEQFLKDISDMHA
ncbi:tyrosine decarboxylase MfnA [Methanoculleus sp. YWC-01]|jgi:tyrosine decarboxylase/aspartate 1-decarboxylase|uniref:Probable L-tyrosine/L-aspartate decarboxylase n=1 Tax=Methanoculleus nereidis TaxID=2735141 RepID=A0ABU3Z1L7_9EURY|nr:tyrosine decarboxylase MfnA [Methanoculleus sp. YWC-01]MCK9299053.1 tyrosine decarboxylase MfnA [Methanoculleus sp.]MDV4342479.1 tyrosine decarboxylase MfnA [Methanoculleus sp. YWC-01]PKL57005.1 MAG: tyrosine decarboxylase MfnA [Methanomicrobiales archaeon HGW-Methanomicrobiales-6]